MGIWIDTDFGTRLMKIRRYLDKDWSCICKIHDLARLDELRSASLIDAFLPLEIAAEKEGLFCCQLLVAERNGVVSGFLAYNENEIAWLYVDPTCYRSGVGKALVNAVTKMSSQTLSIEILKGNTAALEFYKSCGFIEIGIAKGRMPGNENYEVTVHELSNAIMT
jgi:ribosomal protein S18 acetylase RimI-like enzyme